MPEILLVANHALLDDAIVSMVCCVDTVEAALNHVRAGGSPELIVLACERPGQFSTAAIDALHRAAPLARYERVAGSWCDGEQRSGQPPSGCVNHYWHQWPPRFARDLAQRRNDRLGTWGLPPTMAADERLLAGTGEALATGRGTIVICAERAANALTLAEVCRIGGYRPHVVRGDRDWHVCGARAVLWDTHGEAIADRQSVHRIQNAADGAPLLAVVGFPREDDFRSAKSVGVAAVVSKPYLIRDLLAEMARVATVD